MACVAMGGAVQAADFGMAYENKTEQVVKAFGCRFWFVIYDRDNNVVDGGIFESSSGDCVETFARWLFDSTPAGGWAESGS